MNEHIELLGYRAKDKITGMEGVITSICFDLYGCVQAVLNPGLDKDGKPKENFWYDVNRLEISKKSVMKHPPFPSLRAKVTGPAEKPSAGKP